MTDNDIICFKNWFSDYSRSFNFTDKNEQRNIDLKIEHTHHVCRNIIKIAKDIFYDVNKIRIAETIALFHDVGRFPQFARYKTFKDNISINHGLLGAKTLIGEKVLNILPGREQNLIIGSVRFHSAFKLPHSKDKDLISFLKLIRDADKLDILRVFIEYDETPKEGRASAAGLGLVDSPEYSKEVLSCFYKGQIPSYTTLKTLGDFKLMHLTWLYDLNFRGTFKLLLKRDYINKIIAGLPQTAEIYGAVGALKEYINQRLDSDNQENHLERQND
ncbi:MAG: HD domain-containing protein [Nitrospirae bacterium]|nr:HD domain-containing protein [Nitrospirota bacterium]